MSDPFLDQMLADWDKEEGLAPTKPSPISSQPKKVVPIYQHVTSYVGAPSPIEQLNQYSLTGQSARLRRQMLVDKFVLNKIAILGQWTTIYGAPNSGKTLLTKWLLREALLSDEIDGESLYYINADDNYRGLVDKIELAEVWGMHVIAPHHNGFDIAQIAALMSEMGHGGTARGAVFILDTLKKFTDLMDKRAASEFGQVARGFVSAGGTLIALAHTNKHPDAEGKRVYSGTSDIVDDSDCCFVIDKVSSEERNGVTTHTVEFNNIKARGDVASTVGFTFERRHGQSYEALIDTVKRLERNDLDDIKGKASVESELEHDAPIIEAICTVISAGTVSKSKIVQKAHELSGKSSANVRKVLDKRTGEIFELGHRWRTRKQAHNRHVYEILPTHKKLNN